MYYAVIFTSTRTEVEEGYAEMAIKMVELAKHQPGFIGLESARSEIGITVSYWESLEAIKAWKKTPNIFLRKKKEKPLGIKTIKLELLRLKENMSFSFFN